MTSQGGGGSVKKNLNLSEGEIATIIQTFAWARVETHSDWRGGNPMGERTRGWGPTHIEHEIKKTQEETITSGVKDGVLSKLPIEQTRRIKQATVSPMRGDARRGNNACE